jgi:hypothetical protein
MFEVEFYSLADGTKPVEQFIKSIEDDKLRAKVIRNIKLLETFGSELRMPESKHIENGIYELRTIQSNNIVRCLYFFYTGKKLLLQTGGSKKQKNTPGGNRACKNKES